MVCARCGKSVPASAGTCPACGAGIAVGVLTPPPAALGGALLDQPFVEGPGAISESRHRAVPPGAAPVQPDEALTGGLPVEQRSTSLTEAATRSAPATGRRGPLVIGQSFGHRYHIIRLLGVGGMGAVYQAWDAELGIAVAIKVIRPEVTADPASAADVERRFKRELVLARQVTHKNVVRIHDLGEIDGIKYLTMPYVEGSDLASLLRREGRLPIERTLRIIRSVVSGLVAAHAAGVIHRDLKPANIMIGADGEALIMDFGIARSTGAAVDDRVAGAPTIAGSLSVALQQPDVTMAGAVVGTVEYMAPELACGLPADRRADVYALGLIFYDMLVGRSRTVTAADPIAELRGRMEQPPPRVRSIVKEVPEPLDHVVSRCLEPDPAKRYQSAAELAAALDRIDERGHVIRAGHLFGVPVLASIVVLALTLVGAGWWYASRLIPPAQHEPVSLLIADFDNKTGDPAFDRALEPMFKLALEGANFVSAYDRNGIARLLGVRPPEKLDERAAQELAVKQGAGIVLSGVLERQGNGFGITVRVTEAITGRVLATATNRAGSKDQVLGAATRVASSVREALGDATSERDKRFAMETLSATSIDVVHDFAAAAQAMSDSRFDEALRHFARAVERDPKFGLAYAGMAISSRNLGRRQDAEKYIKQAVSYVDSMTERERYRTRGLYYYLTGDYQQCVKEFGDLVERYPADPSARNNLALCLTYLRDIPRAVSEMQQVVKIVPRRPLYSENLLQYTAYAGDFQSVIKSVQAMRDPGLYAALALAFAQLGAGQIPDATRTFTSLEKMNRLGASYAASGLGDIALYEGRLSDAARIFAAGAAADLASNDPDRAASKFAALAYTQQLLQQQAAAVAVAQKALDNSQATKIQFLTARVFIQAGSDAAARKLAADLAAQLQAEPQAYAKILEGETALKNGNAREAVQAFMQANTLLDTWIGHYDLGRAYLEARAFTQADSEFDRCLKRRGEALSLFVDEEPTYGFFPPVYYLQGRAREGLKTATFADSYRTYLSIRGRSKEDPLLPEVRRRAGG